jgi:signal transduction histidine kinase
MPLLVFFALATLTWIGHRWQARVQSDAAEYADMQASAAITAEIRERLQLHSQFLRSLLAFAATHPRLDLVPWQRFAREIDFGMALPGLFTFAYAPALRAPERPQAIAALRRQATLHDFRIFPETSAELTTPVIFAAPDSAGLQRSIGFDLSSEAVRREAIDAAIVQRDVALSGPIVPLIDRPQAWPGFLMLLALYHPDRPLNDVAARRAAFAGLVLTAYRTDEFLSRLKQAAKNRLAFRIVDESLAASRSPDDAAKQIFTFGSVPESTGVAADFHHEIDFGGRNWTLYFYREAPSGLSESLDAASLILYGGLALSALLALLIFQLSTHRDRAERHARRVTRKLRAHRDHLHELVAERTARLESALLSARAASQAKSEFLANMSHELRTPMHAILSFAELGANRGESVGIGKLRQYFQRIEQSAHRLLGLINELLDIAKLEAGRADMHLASTDLSALIQDARAQLESLLLPRQLMTELIVSTANTMTLCDSERIRQVIQNLLANAIRFSPQGGTIRIEIAASTLSGGRRADDNTPVAAVAIRVFDQGIGIPEGELEHIFEKFVQSSATRTGAGGTGLGLAISRAIVMQHRGTIVASNNLGGGACFTVTLPADSRTRDTGAQ